MAVRDTLNRVENLVASAWHLPLTGKAMIDEEELTNLIEDLRHDLPQELEQAEKVIQERETILKSAQQEADAIKKEAKVEAERLVNENDIVVKARQTSQMLINEAQRQSAEYIEQAQQQAFKLQQEANAYADQVFDKLLEYIRNTYQGVQSAGAELENAWNVLNQAKLQKEQQHAQAQNPYPPPDTPPPDYQSSYPVPQQDYQEPPQQN